MIEPTGYVLRCEQPRCDASEYNHNRRWLLDNARDEGWQIHVNPNGEFTGELAVWVGKDYCPEHRRGEQLG